MFHSCCCWKDLKDACLATAMLSLVTSVGQIFVATAGFTGEMGNTPSNIFGTETAIQLKLYVALFALDFFIIIVSIILMVGLEKGSKGRAMPYLMLMPFYLMYESAINIYYFVQEFGSITKYPSTTNPLFQGSYGYTITPLVYWAFKDIFLFIGYLCILSYFCYHSKPREKKIKFETGHHHEAPLTKLTTLNQCTNPAYNGPMPVPQVSQINIHDLRPYSDRPAVPPPRIYDDYGRMPPCHDTVYTTRPQPTQQPLYRQYNY